MAATQYAASLFSLVTSYVAAIVSCLPVMSHALLQYVLTAMHYLIIQAFQSQSGRLYLVFEYVPSTMLHLLRTFKSGLPLAQVKVIMRQLIQAVDYLHKNEVSGCL